MLILLLLSLNLSLFSNPNLYQKIKKNFEFNFEFEEDKFRLEAVELSLLSNKYAFEPTLFSLIMCTEDAFNKKRTNFSITPLLQFLYFYRYSEDQKLQLFYFLNTKFHVLLLKPDKIDSIYNFTALSFFVKNNTDFFVFRKKPWLQLSPGIGLNAFFGKQFHIRFGVARNYACGIKEKRIENAAFISFGFRGLGKRTE